MLSLGLTWLAPMAALAARARPARAAGPPAARKKSDTSRQVIARRHFREGKRWFFRRKYKRAIQSFLQAYQYWDHPSVLYNLASAYALQRQPVKARVYLRIFLKRTKRNPRRLPRVLRRVLKETGILAVHVREGPKDMEIYVDGRAVGHKSVEIVVLPGQRVVEIRLGDRVVRKHTVDVHEGGERTWEIERIAPPPPPRRAVTVAPPPKPRPRRRLHWAWFVSVGSTTVALFAAALGTSVQNAVIHRDFERDPWDTSLASRGRRMQTAANVLWGLTAGAAAASAALVFFTRWRRKEAPTAGVTVTPTLGPGTAGCKVEW